MFRPSSPAQTHLSEDDGSGSDAGSEVSLEPETDRFGFILTNGSTAGSVGPLPELVRQRETKWINIILQWDRMLLKKTSKVKVQCQKGIPASLRAKCWPLLCAASDRMKQNENLYESLDSQPALQSWVDLIERDLGRQFPFHEMFLCKDGHGQRGLFRVLKAYTQYQPEEGYCQAQGPVAAVLLMNMPAEEAFWCLVQISEQYLPGYYSPLLEGVLFDAGMLTWVLRKTCPAAHKHLQHHGVEPLMFATDWLMCLYTRHLPFNTLLRVWDLFFCYGVRVLLQVAVVLVRRVLGRAEQRKQCQGQMETLERLRGVREQVQEEDDVFIAEVCSVPLSTRRLEKQTEKELEKWRKDRPSSTFDPRGRCHGYQVAWAWALQNKEERDRKERKTGNLSVPLARSASTLSLSPSLFHKRLRKGGKVNTGDWEGGVKVVRHLSMGAKEDWRSWNEFNFKRVQGVQEEEDVEEHKKQSEPKLTGQTKEKEPSEEPKKTDEVQTILAVHTKETEIVKEQNDQAETGSAEMEESQPKETEDDKKLSEQRLGTDEETEQHQRPVKDQTVEDIPQPTDHTSQKEQGEEVGSQALEQSHNVQDKETEVKDTKEETEEVSQSEQSDAVEVNLSEIQKDIVANTYTDRKMVVNIDDEQVIQADMKPEEGADGENEQQMHLDTVTEVSETRTKTSSETDGSVEAAAFTDPSRTTETDTQEKVITEPEKTSQVEVKYRSTESLTGKEIKEEFNAQTETETEEQVEENAATQDELETDIIQTDSELKDLKTETKPEAETLIPSLPKGIQPQEDTEEQIPVNDDNNAKEQSEVFAHCPEKECDEVTSEPTQEKGVILTVHSELVNDQRPAEETATETQINVEATDSVTSTVKEETSQQAEAENLNAQKTGLVETSTSEEPVPEEPTSQVTVEKEIPEHVQESTVGEEDVFLSAPDVTGNPHTDNNPKSQNIEDFASESINGGSTRASGRRSSRSSGDFCVRKSSGSRGSRLARKLSSELFTAPQKTSQQPQSISNHTEAKHTESQSNPGAVSSEGTAAQKEPPVASKRFGLFHRLRGGQPKKGQEKGAQKMQVPKILIQDFGDGTGTGRPVEVVECEENLSSRERRRRRREGERREKEEERLRKKNEKEMEKERVRRKPQTRGKSFQGQKERSSNDPPRPAKTCTQTLRYSPPYAESYF
ncbi:ecotropic viral integration site 5 ortholog isoform X1 [Scophthalmus maximus]|uniref:ecotropic viral integration site 5 ortholog isoform X1 n=2 Tax=Scophthalmus maximus TaxID=52904 RepID=UPI001FA861D4|nr:ecotropic viral integration site 5 ortholog isoform X1 [Scophthalmus maximus]